MTSWTIDIPTEPTKRLVAIDNIALKTEREAIEDFFSFCGIIESLEIKVDGEHKIGLILFEEDSAANTAVQFSEVAVIDDNPIKVEPYFKSAAADSPDTKLQSAEVTTDTSQSKDGKSVSHVMAELLASGYVLTDNVLKKGVEFDERYNVSTRVNGYINKMAVNFNQLNNKISKSSHNEIHDITDRNEKESAPKSPKKYPLFHSKAGSKMHTIASRMVDKVNMIHEDAKKIVDEKKRESELVKDKK